MMNGTTVFKILDLFDHFIYEFPYCIELDPKNKKIRKYELIARLAATHEELGRTLKALQAAYETRVDEAKAKVEAREQRKQAARQRKG